MYSYLPSLLSKRPQVKMPQNSNVSKLVITVSLKRLKLYTGKISRNLIILFKIGAAKRVWEGVFVNSCAFQRATNSQFTKLVDLHFLYCICLHVLIQNLVKQILKQLPLNLKCVVEKKNGNNSDYKMQN